MTTILYLITRDKEAAHRYGRWARPLALGLSFVILSTGLAIIYFAGSSHQFPVFDDLRIYQDATRRLLAGEGWYLARQAGPYELLHGDVLYPPVTAWFFLPWLVLPQWTFMAVPVAVLGWFVWQCRPRAWAWPLIALCLAYPPTLLYIVFANPALWIAVFVALGLRYQWPGVLVLLKPSLAPLALIGIRSRGWWVGFGVLMLLTLPVLAQTLDYPRILLDSRGGGLTYSIIQLPLMGIPLLAWLGRDHARVL